LSEKERTVNISLRISESAYRALQEDAKKLNISLNTIANQIFRGYAEYDRHLNRFAMLKITSPTFMQILNAIPDDAAFEAGRGSGTQITPGVILSIEGELSASSISGFLKRMGTYSGLFDYSEIVHGGKVSVTLSHNLGPKWSLCLAGYGEAMYKVAGVQVKSTRLLDSVTFQFTT
jgi:hypothetical protein